MKLVPEVHPNTLAVLRLYINDEYSDKATIDVKILMKEVQIAGNVGNGLHVTVIPTLVHSSIQLRMQEVKLVQNVLVQENFQFYCAVVRFDELIINSAGDVFISLESVEMSNNNFVPLDGHIIIGISALSVVNTEVH